RRRRPLRSAALASSFAARLHASACAAFALLRNRGLPLGGQAVRETLALGALNGKRRTLLVVHAKLGASVVAEFKLYNVTAEIFLSAVLVGAYHPALKHVEEAFG